MEKYSVYLFIGGSYRKCALLKFDGSTYYLGYGTQYLQSPDAIAIDPLNLPLYPKAFESETIFGALKDSSPDRWGRYLLEKKFNRPLSEMEYILANGIDHVGALGLSPEQYDAPVKLTPSGYVSHSSDQVGLDVIIHQTEMTLRNEDDQERLKELLNYGPSLGGARPKYGVNAEGGPYLAKYSVSQDIRREPLIEFATMSMAKAVGLNVPAIKLGRTSDRDVFYIERFDREGIEKKPFVSALSACGWDENDYALWSYLLLAEALIKIGKNEQMIKEDLKELFRRIAFNIAVNNDDDHPRNHGILFNDGAWRLSPLYDVVPKDSQTQSFRLAMELGVQRREASKKNLLSSCEYFKLGEGEASALIDEIFTFVAANWRIFFSESGLTDAEAGRFENAMRPKP